MSLRPLVPKGDALRHAVAWLIEQSAWSAALVEEASRRFDLNPLEEDFLMQELHRFHASGAPAAPKHE